MRRDYETQEYLGGRTQPLGLQVQTASGSFYVYSNVTGFGMPASQLAKILAKDARVVGYRGALSPTATTERTICVAYTRT